MGSEGDDRSGDEDALIANALRVVNEEPERLGDVMDVDMLLTYFAVSAIASNTDGFTGPFEVDDHFQYYDPQTGKFVILPWDPDNTFGSINDLPDADIYLNYERCILTRMVRDGTLHDAFLTKLEEVMNRVPARAVKDQADAIFNEIGSAAMNDTTKMYPTESFVWSLDVHQGLDRQALRFDPQPDRGATRAGGRRARRWIRRPRRWTRRPRRRTEVRRDPAGDCGSGRSGAGVVGRGLRRRRRSSDVDNACGFRDGEPNNNAERCHHRGHGGDVHRLPGDR